MEIIVMSETKTTYLTIPQLSDRHPAFKESGIRNLIFQAKDRQSSKGVVKGNGLAPAIIRIGRKVLIDEARFLEWVKSHRESDEA